MKFPAAIAELERSLDVVETNERITREDPTAREQNELRRDNAEQYRGAIAALKQLEAA